MMRTRRWAALALVTTTASACSGSFGMPRGATREGRAIFDLWQTMFVSSIIVAGIVYALIAYSTFRYRARGRTDVIRDAREHPWLEITYTIIPIAIVAFLWVITWRTNNDVMAVRSEPTVTVDVEAYSWGWRFTYPALGVTVVSQPGGPVPEMVLPVDERSTISLTSLDVIHAWYVPEFLYKHDAIPGRTARFDITPEQTGLFGGACAEFCGLNHAYMRFAVRVVSADEFESWAVTAASGTASSVSTTPASSATSATPSPASPLPVGTGPTGSTAEAEGSP